MCCGSMAGALVWSPPLCQVHALVSRTGRQSPGVLAEQECMMSWSDVWGVSSPDGTDAGSLVSRRLDPVCHCLLTS